MLPSVVLERTHWAIRDKGMMQGVYVKCPSCGLEAQLAHEVNGKGEVVPELDCPRIGCSFQKDVVLRGWPQRHSAVNGEMMVLTIPMPFVKPTVIYSIPRRTS